LSHSNGPDADVNTTDPGDDIQKRFFYQNSYAAIVCCAFLQNYPIKEIYCEHHEDVLVKFEDDTFEGIQVKTKDLHLPGFSFDEDAIQKSISRFVGLELKYPGKFKSFKIVTNTSCLRRKGNDLAAVIADAKDNNVGTLLANRSKTKKCLNEMAKKMRCSTDDVVKVLSKIVLREQFSNLNDNKKHLVDELGSSPNLGQATLGVLRAIAEKIIFACCSAANKTNEEVSECYLLGKDFVDVRKKAILEGKKLTKAKVISLIESITKGSISHFLKDENSLGFKEMETHRLELKLDAGGVDNANINLLKDLKYSFEVFSASWLHRYDSQTAMDRYNQIQLIVNSECQEAFDESIQQDKLFGTDMLVNLRKRLRERLKTDREIFLGCDYEHLMGLAGVLTEDCKIWWSKVFKIDNL
jgi:hypothetical protein